MNNIAILRDPDDLHVTGFAPIFDSGNSMFYSTQTEKLQTLHTDQIQTHSFVAREVRLLSYVQDRNIVDLSRVEPDFSVYEKDIPERQARIPYVKELFERKLSSLESFQKGRDIWKTR